LAWGGCGLDSTGSGQGPVAGCCECGDEPSGSCATELVSVKYQLRYFLLMFGFHEVWYEFLCHWKTFHIDTI
jgi:hypothetical protein